MGEANRLATERKLPVYIYLRVFGILNITHNSGRETRGQLSISRIAPPLRGSEPLLLFVGG